MAGVLIALKMTSIEHYSKIPPKGHSTKGHET
jgi:hypothetical protein